MDETVEFGAELTFDAERGCASTAPTGAPDVRTAAKLTLVVTAVHERTPNAVFSLFDRVFDDRAGAFESVAIDVSDAATDAAFVGTLREYLAASDWDGSVHVDSIDSYYEYDPDRLLVTPERYSGSRPAEIEASADTPTDGIADTPAEASEST